MILGENIYNCFSNRKKRRLLNILRYFPMTHKDFVDATGFSKRDIYVMTKEFTDADLVFKLTISHKFRIFMNPILDTKIGIDYVYDERGIRIEGKRKLTKKSTNGTPHKMLGMVFSLFKFEDPIFQKDISYLRKNKTRAILYLSKLDHDEINKIEKSYKHRKAMRNL